MLKYENLNQNSCEKNFTRFWENFWCNFSFFFTYMINFLNIYFLTTMKKIWIFLNFFNVLSSIKFSSSNFHLTSKIPCILQSHKINMYSMKFLRCHKSLLSHIKMLESIPTSIIFSSSFSIEIFWLSNCYLKKKK